MKDNKEKKIREKDKKVKEKKPNKFVETIKKRWLINGTKTIILVAIIILAFIAINMLMQNLELAPIDFSQEQLYTLTDESKEKVKDIDKEISIYFVGYTDDDANLDLAKQYNKANEKITAEAVDINNRPDLAEKYGIESGSEGIIVECGEKSKVLTASDLVTYDTSTYETISIAEEKFTSAILSVSSDEIPKVYFLEGYSNFSLTQNMYYLDMYLANEINEVSTLNVLSTGNIPEDCDTLVITTPSKDFDDVVTKAITDYINRGGNILWLNSAVAVEEKQNFTNVNSILAMYAVDPFELGIIRETDTSKMVSGSADVIFPTIQSSTATKDLYNTQGVIFVNATKINVNEEQMEAQNVTKTELLNTGENSYFRTNFNNNQNSASSDEEVGSFLVGAELQKTIQEANEDEGTQAITSKLIIYGENYFITDNQLSSNSAYPMVQLAYNKDLVLNSIAYLVDREEDISVRKSTGTVTYTATEQQDTIVKTIIFGVPAIIILVGIVVWQVRRRKK